MDFRLYNGVAHQAAREAAAGAAAYHSVLEASAARGPTTSPGVDCGRFRCRACPWRPLYVQRCHSRARQVDGCDLVVFGREHDLAVGADVVVVLQVGIGAGLVLVGLEQRVAERLRGSQGKGHSSTRTSPRASGLSTARMASTRKLYDKPTSGTAMAPCGRHTWNALACSLLQATWVGISSRQCTANPQTLLSH